MLKRLAAIFLVGVLASSPVRAESVPASPNGEPLPQVDGLSAKEIAIIATAIVAGSIAAYRAGAKGYAPAHTT
jgi:hypothetical protein